jgi:protein SCO1
MTSNKKLAVALSVPIVLFTCSKQEQKQTNITTFPLKGVVVAIDTVKHRLMISHEAIPNYMDAMTMSFRVKNLELLKSVQVGDSIQGVLAVSSTETWLERFEVVGKGGKD